MKVFIFTFEYWTRPWFGKGRLKAERHALSANDATQAMRLAKKYGETTFKRTRWFIGQWNESLNNPPETR